MLRRLHKDQPDSFAFTPANQAWAEAQMTKFPEGRRASAIIPLLWRAQEQEGWLSRPAIEHVAEMLGLAYIRALEVATFYFMFQLQPVGNVAHIQICGTTSCMICGAEDLVAVCKDKIAKHPHDISDDGKLSWEEVECLGACANAPMAQIGKDYYEDLTAEGFAQMLDDFRAGKVPTPGPQNGRFTSEPLGGATALTAHAEAKGHDQNASVALAAGIGDTVKRIDGTEVALTAPWQQGLNHGATLTPPAPKRGDPDLGPDPAPAPEARTRGDASDGRANTRGTDVTPKAKPALGSVAPESSDAAGPGTKPAALDAPRPGGADDLKRIKGIGPKLEKLCNSLGFWHFDQIAAWSPDEVSWVDDNLEGFKGRVTRDEWVKQAKLLAEGGETEFSSRVKKGDVY
ncbi:MAG: NADH-quinone oxidoreductase subunit E [Pseudomonadota bacterium]